MGNDSREALKYRKCEIAERSHLVIFVDRVIWDLLVHVLDFGVI